jgi:O-antigen ligase
VIRRRVLAFAAAVEIGTGLVLLVDPALVVQLLLGEPAVGVAVLLGRCFGVALLALGIACWPQGPRKLRGSAPLLGMGVYNVLVAAYLGYLGTVEHLRGPLLWPAVVLHAGVAVLLLLPRRGEHDIETK